jgi:chromate transporter
MASTIGDLARLFLKLGTTAFGGPAAHIAMMEEEVVRRRNWLTREEFLDLIGAVNLIPGPNSTELAIHIGQRRAGWRGLLVAGICFILPAALIVGGLAWVYVRYGTLPAAEGVLYGVKPVVIAVIVQALRSLGGTALKTRTLALIGALAFAAVALGVHELLVLAGAGILAVIVARTRAGGGPPHEPATTTVVGPWASPLGAGALAVAATPVGLWPLFLVFLKIGSVLFGSGYVLLAFLRADLVERLGWLNERQLLDAVAIGQVTPGPVFTTATFIGYLLGGASGAVVATVGIFLPAFVFVAASGPLIPRIRRSPTASAVLDGVNAASLALMALVAVQLGRAALVDPIAIAIALASTLLLVHWRVNSAWLVIAGAVLGVVLRW